MQRTFKSYDLLRLDGSLIFHQSGSVDRGVFLVLRSVRINVAPTDGGYGFATGQSASLREESGLEVLGKVEDLNSWVES